MKTTTKRIETLVRLILPGKAVMKKLAKTAATYFTGFVLTVNPMVAAAREIPINPITPDVQDKIRESYQVVSGIEEGVAPQFEKLEKALKENKECVQRPSDKGCSAIKAQIGESAKEVLEQVEVKLPEIKKAIGSTAKALGVSIHKKSGLKNIDDMYQDISKSSALPKSRGPLSARLGNILSIFGSKSNTSILEMSLQTQADLIAATEMIDYLDLEISRLKTMIITDMDMGTINPDMAEVFSGVAELFGIDFDVDYALENATLENVTTDEWLE